jgi:hypothetical protein
MPRVRHAAEEGERPRMGVEHHLLRLARIGPHIDSPAVAQPHMRHLHRIGLPAISTSSWLQSNW